jgi:aryl-alcohol dehydrogenase-like predicted oxidoreductase
MIYRTIPPSSPPLKGGRGDVSSPPLKGGRGDVSSPPSKGGKGDVVSVLAMGTHMNLGHSLSESESRALVDAAIEGGINLFDTADAYAGGEAETVLGRCLRDYPRESLCVMTKVGAPIQQSGSGVPPLDKQSGSGVPPLQGLSPSHITRQINASLARLEMDYVDIYLCHREDPETTIGSIVETMSALIDTGKIRHWGVSNWSVGAIADANAYARGAGRHPVTVCQARYNLLYREPEPELFPLLIRENIAATTFSPLAHGVLAGIYPLGQPPPPGTRAAMPGENDVTLALYYNQKNLGKAQALVEIAAGLGTTAAALATAWCTTHPAVTSVILGPWNAQELQQNLAAASLELDDTTQTRLEHLFKPDETAEG